MFPSPPKTITAREDLSGIQLTLPRLICTERLFSVFLVVCIGLPLILSLLTALWSLQGQAMLAGIIGTCVLGAITVVWYMIAAASWWWALSLLRLRTRRPVLKRSTSLICCLLFGILTPFTPVIQMANLLWSVQALSLLENQALVFAGSTILFGVTLLLAGLISIRRPRLTLDPTAVSIEGFGRQRYPLEELSINNDDAPLCHNNVPIITLNNLVDTERQWLIRVLRPAIARRKRALTAAGHDLVQPAVIPAALQKLQQH